MTEEEMQELSLDIANELHNIFNIKCAALPKEANHAAIIINALISFTAGSFVHIADSTINKKDAFDKMRKHLDETLKGAREFLENNIETQH